MHGSGQGRRMKTGAPYTNQCISQCIPDNSTIPRRWPQVSGPETMLVTHTIHSWLSHLVTRALSHSPTHDEDMRFCRRPTRTFTPSQEPVFSIASRSIILRKLTSLGRTQRGYSTSQLWVTGLNPHIMGLVARVYTIEEPTTCCASSSLCDSLKYYRTKNISHHIITARSHTPAFSRKFNHRIDN